MNLFKSLFKEDHLFGRNIEVLVNAMHSGQSGSLGDLNIFLNKLGVWEYLIC